MQRPPWKVLVFAIVGFWATMTGLLLYRDLGSPAADVVLDSEDRLDAATETWLGLYAGDPELGNRVGHAHLQLIPESRGGLDGVAQRMAVDLTLQMFGRSTELNLSGAVWRPYMEERAEFDFRIDSGPTQFSVDGRIELGTLSAIVRSAGESLPIQTEVDPSALFSAGFGSALKLPKLDVGEEVVVDTFDPMTLRSAPSRVRCTARQTLTLGGKTIRTSVVTVESGGLESRAWLDENGEVVKASTPVGLSLMRITPEQAMAPIGDNTGAVGEFLRLTAVTPRGQNGFRGARSMTIAVRGESAEALGELPTDDSQRAATREGEGEGEGEGVPAGAYRIQPGAARESAGTAASAPRFLASDAFVQTDHPRIARKSAELVAGLETPESKADAIGKWVYETLEKTAVLSVPSALEVLESERGDCNEHTVLYVALARAAQIPSRIAIGLVWSEDLQGFYYHAWPEILIDGRWIWTDPTLGQPVADATHIKLFNGGIETWSRLLPYLGSLELEILDIE